MKKLSIKIVSLFFLTAVIASCFVSPSYEVTRPSDRRLSRVVNEISSSELRNWHELSMFEARERVQSVSRQLKGSAQRLCRYLAERSSPNCSDWQIEVEDNDEPNAYAVGSDDIVISRGVVEQSNYDDELALVLAHELSHHMLNHLVEEANNMNWGGLLGGLGTLLIMDIVFPDLACTQDCDELIDAITSVADIGAGVGAVIAKQKYSVAHESEADMMAAYILSHAGFSLIKARESLLHMAKRDGIKRTRSSFFDTHPVGPERLAQFDIVIEEVLSNVNRLP